jgi:hypothetical protein
MFRITRKSTSTKKIVSAKTLKDLICTGCEKLGISCEVVLELADGFPIEDDTGFDYALSKDSEVFFIEK